MDPLSALAITRSCLSIASVCGGVIWELKKFIDETKLVGHAINSLHKDVEAFEKVLSLLKHTVEEPNIKASIESSAPVARHWGILKSTLDDAETTLNSLSATISKVGEDVRILDSARKHIRLQSASREIKLHQERITSYHRTIDVTLQAAILTYESESQESLSRMAVRLDDLSSFIREQVIQINNRITSIQQTISNGVENLESPGERDSEMEALYRQRNCLRSSASVVSSALTVIQSRVYGTSTVAQSDLGDIFPRETNETTRTWVEFHWPSHDRGDVFPEEINEATSSGVEFYQPSHDLGYLDGGDIDLDLATEFYNMAISKRSENSDAEAELYLNEFLTTFAENEAAFSTSSRTLKMKHSVLTELYGLSKAQEKLIEAEKYLGQSLAVVDHLILLSEVDNNTTQKEEWLKVKVRTYTNFINDSTKYEQWEKAEQYLQKKIMLLSQGGRAEYTDFMVDKLELGEILSAKGQHTEALGFGRMAYSVFKKQGEEGKKNCERSLQLLINICTATQSSARAKGYINLLHKLQQAASLPNPPNQEEIPNQEHMQQKRGPEIQTGLQQSPAQHGRHRSETTQAPPFSPRAGDTQRQNLVSNQSSQTENTKSKGNDSPTPRSETSFIADSFSSSGSSNAEEDMTANTSLPTQLSENKNKVTSENNLESPPVPKPPPPPIISEPVEGSTEVDVDSIIDRLLAVRGKRPGNRVTLPENEIRYLCRTSRAIFMAQPMLLELEAPINVVGTINGQYYDLLHLFEFGGFPPEANYLFLGDYVDYGKQSLETICILLAYKIKYPENFFLLRGNHECASLNRIYGFYDECKLRYNIKLWKTFTDMFNCLPVAALIDEKIFCMHGGLSPYLNSLEQIRRIMRPTDIPNCGLLTDLLWSDPNKDVTGWGKNDRGLSFTFGPGVVSQFLRKHDMDLIVRSHQVVEDGYEFFSKRQLVTLFSAPNFRGKYNAGAMMNVDENLLCSFEVLKPANKNVTDSTLKGLSG